MRNRALPSAPPVRYMRCNFKHPIRKPVPVMAGYQYAFVMKGLTKSYPGGKPVFKDLYLSFLPGAKIAVIGPNGAPASRCF